MENPVIKAIKERRSIRKFSEKKVYEEKIERILEAARWTPSKKQSTLEIQRNPRERDYREDLGMFQVLGNNQTGECPDSCLSR